ncbi:MAG: hypothetical protein GVY26_15620 [Bacteroidetes bacterium]|jgi:O-antigen/teichoic acid export membrane protein|nr:hypothetical protein [Bacteroidota bacterium]
MLRYARLWRAPSKAYQFATLARQGVGVLIAILFAKSPLSAAAIGQYEQLLYVGTLLSAFWVTGLVQALLARYARLSGAGQLSFVWTAYLVVAGLGLVLSLLAWWSRAWWVPAVSGRASLAHLGLFLSYLAVQLPVFLMDNYYLLWERGKRLLIYGLLSYGLQLPVLLVPVWLDYGLEGALWGLLFVAIARHLWLLGELLRHSNLRWDTQLARHWLAAAGPLVLYALVGVLSVSFDSWLVNWQYDGDPQQFAVFRYGAREFPLVVALAAAFSSAMLPALSANKEEGVRALRRRSSRLYHLLFPLCIVLVLSSHWWFPRLFSPAFAASAPIFDVFVLTTVSRLVFARTVLIALQENRTVFYLSVVELAFNIILGFALVRAFGLLGVAWATVAAYTLEKTMLAVYLYRKHGIPPAEYTPLNWLAVYSLLLLFSVVIQ